MRHERFVANRYFKDEHFQEVTNPNRGLIYQLLREWQTAGEPRLIDGHPDDPEGWHARLSDLELKNVAFHGMTWANGRVKGYVSFSRVSTPFDERLGAYLDILQPQLLATLARVLAGEARVQSQHTRRPVGLITAREVEVLTWVRDGKTNDEIAAILGLSMLTVKNHLRHAMRKLDVRTRGQAVAKAIAFGLLHAQERE